MDARSAPSRILGHHAIRFLPTTTSMTGKPIPVEPEAGAMPTNNSFRRYGYQGLLPFRPQPSDRNQNSLSMRASLGFGFRRSKAKSCLGFADEQALTILSNCASSIAKGAKLLIIEMLIPESRGAAFPKLLDMQMMVVDGGRIRTAREFDAMFSKAGFKLERSFRLSCQ
jgi:hypothetical protein